MQPQTEREIELRISHLDDSENPSLYVDPDCGARLCLNQEGAVYTTTYLRNSGTPSEIFHGLTQAWEVPSTLKSCVLAALLKKQATLDLLERVYQGLSCTVDRNSNLRGTLTDDASAAKTALGESLAGLQDDGDNFQVLCSSFQWTAQCSVGDLWPGHMTLDAACDSLCAIALTDNVFLTDDHRLADILLDRLLDEFEAGKLQELTATQRVAVLTSASHAVRLAAAESDRDDR